jgi:thymidylate synthase
MDRKGMIDVFQRSVASEGYADLRRGTVANIAFYALMHSMVADLEAFGNAVNPFIFY